MNRLHSCMDCSGVAVDFNTLDVLGSVGGLASVKFLLHV